MRRRPRQSRDCLCRVSFGDIEHRRQQFAGDDVARLCNALVDAAFQDSQEIVVTETIGIRRNRQRPRRERDKPFGLLESKRNARPRLEHTEQIGNESEQPGRVDSGCRRNGEIAEPGFAPLLAGDGNLRAICRE